MSNRFLKCFGLFALGMGLFLTSSLIFRDSSSGEPVRDCLRSELVLRNENYLCLNGTDTLFNGRLVEHYADGSLKVAIEIVDGRPHGISRGWHDNGQLEVLEHFERGTSHGARTRWYRDGAKKSEAYIVNGHITGIFTRWYENGKKAAEVPMANGKPNGIGKSWHPSGMLRSEVDLTSDKLSNET